MTDVGLICESRGSPFTWAQVRAGTTFGRILRVNAFAACVSHASLAMNVRGELLFGIALQVRLLLFVLWTRRADTRLLN